MKAETITKYVLFNKEYSLKELQDLVLNTIGEEVVDEMTKTTNSPIPRKSALEVLKVLIKPKNRKILNQWLNVKIEDEEGDEVNVLDLPIKW